MRKSFALVLTSLMMLLASCDFSAMMLKSAVFETVELSPDSGEDEVTFLALSDIHLGQEKEATHYEQLLFDTLEAEGKNYPFAILAGDIMDEPSLFAETKAFIHKLNPFVNNNSLYALGNHEVHQADRNSWLRYDFGDRGPSLFSRYTYSGISIYKLDTGERTLGKTQLRALEKALLEDLNKIKIFFTHVPLSGNPLETTTYQLTLSDADERNHLIALMKKYGVGIYLAGHHHIGNWAEHYGKTSGLFIMGSGYKRDRMGFDGDGWFYEITIEKTRRRLVIRPRHFEELSRVFEPVIFDLP